MSFLDQISFGWSKKLPVILQTEATECGLAALVMIANFHGFKTDLLTLRRLFPVSIKGTTLNHLIQLAGALNLTSRPVKLDLEDVAQLRLPCIIHWNFNHFVVLKEVTNKTLTIHDPAQGLRKLTLEQFSDSFTGVALELWPNPGFKKAIFKQNIKLRELMGHVTGLYKSLSQIFLLALALEIFALVAPFYMQWVVDNVIVSADRDLLTTLAIGFGILVLLQQFISIIRSWVIMQMATSLNVQWKSNVFTHLIRLPVEYFEKRYLGDVISRFSAIDQLQHTLTSTFIEAILDGVLTIATLVLMFVYSPMLAWIAVGAMALYGIGRWIWFRPLRNATEERIVHAAKQQTHLLETIRGVKTIKLFQRQEERRSTWLSHLVNEINADLKGQKLQILYRTINGVLFGLERIITIWLGAKLVIDGQFSVGLLLAFIAYKDQFINRVASMIDKLIEMKMLYLQGERLSDIVLSEPEVSNDLVINFDEIKNAKLDIKVENIQYKYSEVDQWVLNDISFHIAEGESVAIVGPSGCGKSTLLSLIIGIRKPSAGNIYFGNHNISQLGLENLRQLIGTVLQDDTLFAGSIADNISFFDHKVDMSWVEECGKKAGVHEEILAMPMGYNTLIGDMGTALSGGQKQRVLLARALYKNPKILLLDEATSHLDIARESYVNEQIKSLKMTRLIIAHRPETIASADRVIEIVEGGKVKSIDVAENPAKPTLS